MKIAILGTSDAFVSGTFKTPNINFHIAHS